MKHAKIVSITNSRNSSKQTSLSPEGRLDGYGLWDAAQIAAIEAVATENRCCEEDNRDYVARIRVMGPVCGIERLGPFYGLLLIILIVI